MKKFALAVKQRFKTSNNQIEEIVNMGQVIIEKSKREQRAEKNKLYKCSLRIVDSDHFNNFIMLCIMMNMLALSLDSYEQNIIDEN